MQNISRMPRKAEKDPVVEELGDLKDTVANVHEATRAIMIECTAIRNEQALLNDRINSVHDICDDIYNVTRIDKSLEIAAENTARNTSKGTTKTIAATMSATILVMLAVTDPSGPVIFLGLSIAVIGTVVSLLSKK